MKTKTKPPRAKAITCQGCGGTISPSFYRGPEPVDDTHDDQPHEDDTRLVYYECEDCGPGCQTGPEDANQPPEFPAPALTA